MKYYFHQFYGQNHSIAKHLLTKFIVSNSEIINEKLMINKFFLSQRLHFSQDLRKLGTIQNIFYYSYGTNYKKRGAVKIKITVRNTRNSVAEFT